MPRSLTGWLYSLLWVQGQLISMMPSRVSGNENALVQKGLLHCYSGTESTFFTAATPKIFEQAEFTSGKVNARDYYEAAPTHYQEAINQILEIEPLYKMYLTNGYSLFNIKETLAFINFKFLVEHGAKSQPKECDRILYLIEQAKKLNAIIDEIKVANPNNPMAVGEAMFSHVWRLFPEKDIERLFPYFYNPIQQDEPDLEQALDMHYRAVQKYIENPNADKAAANSAIDFFSLPGRKSNMSLMAGHAKTRITLGLAYYAKKEYSAAHAHFKVALVQEGHEKFTDGELLTFDRAAKQCQPPCVINNRRARNRIEHLLAERQADPSVIQQCKNYFFG